MREASDGLGGRLVEGLIDETGAAWALTVYEPDGSLRRVERRCPACGEVMAVIMLRPGLVCACPAHGRWVEEEPAFPGVSS